MISSPKISNNCRWILFTFSFFITYTGFAQSIFSVDNIFHYTKNDYREGSQNWDIAQDATGITYFANNNGLLSFDGHNWALFPIFNHTVVRSVAIADDKKIYVGGQEEFGYFEPNGQGILQYHSLKRLIPQKDRNDFADIWKIIPTQEGIFFMSNRRIFNFFDHAITSYSSPNWSFLGQWEKGILAFDDQKGLLKYHQGKWETFIGRKEFPAQIQLTGIGTIGKDSLLLATLENGCFIYAKNRLSPFTAGNISHIASLNIYKMIEVDPHHVVLVTNFGGAFLIDNTGYISHEYTKQEGLQNNNILSGYFDKYKNLWLGLNNGIDMIETNNPIKNIYPNSQNVQPGNAAIIYKGFLYLGTPNGVFKSELGKNKPFTLLPGTEESILSLSVIEDKLLIGTVKNAFEYDNQHLQKLNHTPTGFWNFSLIPNSNTIVAGTFNGLHFFKIINGKIEESNVESVFESAKYVAVAGKKIFALHPYKGLYIIHLNDNLEPTSTQHIEHAAYLSTNQNHLFSLNNSIFLSSEKGTYVWNEQHQKFEIAHSLGNFLQMQNLSFLTATPNGGLWFITKGKLGFTSFPYSNNIKWFNELNGRLQEEENQCIYVLDNHSSIVTADQGFNLIHLVQTNSHNSTFYLYFNKISVQYKGGDSIIYGGYATTNTQKVVLPFANNTINFNFQSIQYNKNSRTLYAYKLEGFEKNWSFWSEKPEKSYTQLPPGDYNFCVKSKNDLSNEIQVIHYSFSILPPWYKTWWFYSLMVLFGIASIVIFSIYQNERYLKIQKRKLTKQAQIHAAKNKELKLKHQLEIEQKNLSIIELQNAKLSGELELKNATIASNAMALAKKGEALESLKEELLAIPEIQKITSLRKLLKKIDSQIDNQGEWETFLTHFDSVNNNYLLKLKEKIPTLTHAEKKLCALLKLDLSSKEMADILNISVKGIEVARYRLRKKLKLAADINLSAFLNELIKEV